MSVRRIVIARMGRNAIKLSVKQISAAARQKAPRRLENLAKRTQIASPIGARARNACARRTQTAK